MRDFETDFGDDAGVESGMPGISDILGIFIDIAESIPSGANIRCNIGSVITRSRITGSDIIRMKIAIM